MQQDDDTTLLRRPREEHTRRATSSSSQAYSRTSLLSFCSKIEFEFRIPDLGRADRMKCPDHCSSSTSRTQQQQEPPPPRHEPISQTSHFTQTSAISLNRRIVLLVAAAAGVLHELPDTSAFNPAFPEIPRLPPPSKIFSHA